MPRKTKLSKRHYMALPHYHVFLIALNKLHNFFSRKQYYRDLNFKDVELIRGLFAFINLLIDHLDKHDAESLEKLLHIHGDTIERIMHARTLDEVDKELTASELVGRGENHFIHCNKCLVGGSFWSHIGHWFKKVGHTIAHTAEKAVHGVENVGKKIEKGVVTGAKDVAKYAKKGYDYEKDHYRAQLATALPYVEKYVVNPLIDTGVTALTGNPELAEAVQTGLTYGEKFGNKYLQKKIKGNQKLL